jgi:hypothetical protein
MTVLGDSRQRAAFAKRPRKAAAIIVMLTFLGSQHGPKGLADSPAPPIPESQATIKPIGSDISQVTLLSKAAHRLDIRTAEIREDPSGKQVIPYASIIYDRDGHAWVYMLSAPLTFVRAKVVVELIKGSDAYLKEGPPAGTQVVTVGANELYGTEIGVNGE